jgi:hypothetical protein
MSMRARAVVLVLAMMLSPLAAVVCELRCTPPASAARVSAHASCHDDGQQGERLQSRPGHCSDRHPDGVVAGVQAANALSTRDMQAVYSTITAVDLPAVSTIALLRCPPGNTSVPRAAASSPPLRI